MHISQKQILYAVHVIEYTILNLRYGQFVESFKNSHS